MRQKLDDARLFEKGSAMLRNDEVTKLEVEVA